MLWEHKYHTLIYHFHIYEHYNTSPNITSEKYCCFAGLWGTFCPIWLPKWVTEVGRKQEIIVHQTICVLKSMNNTILLNLFFINIWIFPLIIIKRFWDLFMIYCHLLVSGTMRHCEDSWKSDCIPINIGLELLLGIWYTLLYQSKWFVINTIFTPF